MKTLLVYASKYGCTEKCARMLAEKLPGEVVLCNLEKDKVAELESFDNVIIGGSIYVGKVQESVTKFCAENMDLLLSRKIGLFLCCANHEQVNTQMRGAYPEPLYSHATAIEHFGHIFNFRKMNFIERSIIKVIAKTKESQEIILTDNLERLASAME